MCEENNIVIELTKISMLEVYNLNDKKLRRKLVRNMNKECKELYGKVYRNEFRRKQYKEDLNGCKERVNNYVKKYYNNNKEEINKKRREKRRLKRLDNINMELKKKGMLEIF